MSKEKIIMISNDEKTNSIIQKMIEKIGRNKINLDDLEIKIWKEGEYDTRYCDKIKENLTLKLYSIIYKDKIEMSKITTSKTVNFFNLSDNYSLEEK
jgi:hypothetical protein